MITQDQLLVKISQVEELDGSLTRYTLVDKDGKDLPKAQPGSHIQIQVSQNITRAYSLCQDMSQNDYYQIMVKKELTGRGGSLKFHNEAKVNSIYSITKPSNFFPLDPNASHFVLIAGGIGITPLLSMAHFLSAHKQPFSLIIFNKEDSKSPLQGEIEDQKWDSYFFSCGREGIESSLQSHYFPTESHFYCCGPEPFMKLIREQVQCLDYQWHQEFFSANNQENQKPITLYLSQSDITIDVSSNENMLSAIRKKGIEVETVCEQGMCGSCVVGWKDGQPDHRDQCLDEEDRKEYLALCCAQCHSKTITLEL